MIVVLSVDFVPGQSLLILSVEYGEWLEYCIFESAMSKTPPAPTSENHQNRRYMLMAVVAGVGIVLCYGVAGVDSHYFSSGWRKEKAII